MVLGEEEIFFSCRCCGYRTIEERNQYFICCICFWEDDGVQKKNDYSSVNRMTLKEARDNFEEFGAVDQKYLKFIDNNGKKKFRNDSK